jgi:hypothetical protein
MMFDQWREAANSGIDRWGEVLAEIVPEPQPVPDEALIDRYVREHRGKPDAVLRFATERVGPSRAEAEAQRYVQIMEAKLQQRRG